MGLVIRNAEKLGVHRDGTLLGLSPFQTEDRRRLWWQLQHLDLYMAIMSGFTPLTLMADWDVKLPLNIEDEEISEDAKHFPPEHKGLTTMSYCLYTYWVLDHQCRFFRSRRGQFELSWQSNGSLSSSVQDCLIRQLEEGLNQRFLQYCDPIKPLDTLIQISARSLISMFRSRVLHASVFGKGPTCVSLEQREALLTSSMESLQYTVALHSQPLIKKFYWWTKSMFPWQPCEFCDGFYFLEADGSSHVCFSRGVPAQGRIEDTTDVGPALGSVFHKLDSSAIVGGSKTVSCSPTCCGCLEGTRKEGGPQPTRCETQICYSVGNSAVGKAFQYGTRARFKSRGAGKRQTTSRAFHSRKFSRRVECGSSVRS